MTLPITFSALKMSFDAVVTASKPHNQVEIDLRSSEFLKQIDELYSTVFSLYEKNAEMLQEKTELEKKLMGYEQWEKEAARYELHEISDMVFVYAYKKNNENKEPMHYCCAKCMGDRKKTILNLDFDGSDGHKTFRCPSCKNYFSTNARAD